MPRKAKVRSTSKRTSVHAQRAPAKSTRTKPSTQPILPDASHGFSSIVQIAHNILVNPDIAFRTDRKMSDQMIRDPMVLGPLYKRMLATAQLQWQIVPEDDTDPRQVEVAEGVEAIIRRTPRLIDLFMDLLWGIFRGTGAGELYWMQDQFTNNWRIGSHRPHHGDKITFDVHGNPHMLTREFQTGGRPLNDGERDRLIIHIHDREDGTFLEGEEAGYVFKGRGLRDAIWPYWWLKHNALRFWVQFMERFGGGFITGTYPMNNKPAKKAMEKVLKNLMNNSKVSIPVPNNAKDREVYGIEVHEVSGNRGTTQMFNDFVDGWAGKHIRIVIEGQEQAQVPGGGGLGDGRAKQLRNIFEMYREFDARSLGATLTETLVERTQRFNFGVLPFRCRFEYVLDSGTDRDPTTLVQQIRLAGLPVGKAWLYGELGIPIPAEDEEIIDFGAQGLDLGASGLDPSSLASFMGPPAQHAGSRPADDALARAGLRMMGEDYGDEDDNGD